MTDSYFEPVIGLEIHVELKTGSKMFCACSNDYFGKKPNCYTCPVCLGLPGALPVPNSKAIEWCIVLGLALNCEIPLTSKFDRKNYFYPDLPKGYQISQYDNPFCKNGWVDIKSKIQNPKRIGIRRVHMEEDTGKLLHAKVNGKNVTLIDFNRSGVPLVEIVTEPDIKSSEEAKTFLQELQLIIRYLGISDADMEKGSMRLEPNISVKHLGGKDKESRLPNYKVEVKNINSFNFVKKAIDYEIKRQIEILERGETPVQETRGWNENRGQTYSQRTKEEAHDYRYFPEPDIPPFIFNKTEVENLRSQLPELPRQRRAKFRSLGLKEKDCQILVSAKEKGDFFEKSFDIVRRLKLKGIGQQEIANRIVNEKIDIKTSTPAQLIKIISEKRTKSEISSDILQSSIEKVISQNPKAASDYKKGKQAALMFLIGQVLKETKGKGKPEGIRNKLLKLLK